MKLLNERVLIREVAQKWEEQYARYRGSDPRDTEEKRSIGRKLAALDGETATAADVEAIVGNASWTRIDHCDECGEENLPEAVVLADDSESPVTICMPCLRKALRLPAAGKDEQ
jgi:formylmethanofuran dehydrogenase subunit E